MAYDDEVTIRVLKGVKVNVEEVAELDNERQFVAQAPQDLKLAITRVSPRELSSGASTITMCG